MADTADPIDVVVGSTPGADASTGTVPKHIAADAHAPQPLSSPESDSLPDGDASKDADVMSPPRNTAPAVEVGDATADDDAPLSPTRAREHGQATGTSIDRVRTTSGHNFHRPPLSPTAAVALRVSHSRTRSRSSGGHSPHGRSPSPGFGFNAGRASSPAGPRPSPRPSPMAAPPMDDMDDLSAELAADPLAAIAPSAVAPSAVTPIPESAGAGGVAIAVPGSRAAAAGSAAPRAVDASAKGIQAPSAAADAAAAAPPPPPPAAAAATVAEGDGDSATGAHSEDAASDPGDIVEAVSTLGSPPPPARAGEASASAAATAVAHTRSPALSGRASTSTAGTPPRHEATHRTSSVTSGQSRHSAGSSPRMVRPQSLPARASALVGPGHGQAHAQATGHAHAHSHTHSSTQARGGRQGLPAGHHRTFSPGSSPLASPRSVMSEHSQVQEGADHLLTVLEWMIVDRSPVVVSTGAGDNTAGLGPVHRTASASPSATAASSDGAGGAHERGVSVDHDALSECLSEAKPVSAAEVGVELPLLSFEGVSKEIRLKHYEDVRARGLLLPRDETAIRRTVSDTNLARALAAHQHQHHHRRRQSSRHSSGMGEVSEAAGDDDHGGRDGDGGRADAVQTGIAFKGSHRHRRRSLEAAPRGRRGPALSAMLPHQQRTTARAGDGDGGSRGGGAADSDAPIAGSGTSIRYYGHRHHGHGGGLGHGHGHGHARLGKRHSGDGSAHGGADDSSMTASVEPEASPPIATAASARGRLQYSALMRGRGGRDGAGGMRVVRGDDSDEAARARRVLARVQALSAAERSARNDVGVASGADAGSIDSDDPEHAPAAVEAVSKGCGCVVM